MPPLPAAEANQSGPSAILHQALAARAASAPRATSFTTLYSFKSGTDGENPGAALLSLNDTLYGTTEAGGANGTGTVHSFGTGGTPRAPLIAVNGILYGTTEAGGNADSGTVFAITTAGAEHIVHSFGLPSDGANPYAGLLNVSGELYGTTYDSGGGAGYGCVFQVDTAGKERVAYRFGYGPGGNGADPSSPLINVSGALYGTTSDGAPTRPARSTNYCRPAWSGCSIALAASRTTENSQRPV